MIELVRRLLDRPVDPRHARAIVAIASCLTLGFAVLVALGMTGGSRPSTMAARAAASPRPTAPPSDSAVRPPRRPARGGQRSTAARRNRRQDPQDRRGSSAYRRAHRAVRENRALQHLPFRRRGVSITLAGADRGHAVIEIVAPTVAEARRRWRGFLKRYDDDGGSYEARFRAWPGVAAGRRRRVAGGGAEGFAGPVAGHGTETAGIRHHKRHRTARGFLKSPPQPKRSS